MKFTILTRDVAPYLVDRYSERKETAEELSKRVGLRSIAQWPLSTEPFDLPNDWAWPYAAHRVESAAERRRTLGTFA